MWRADATTLGAEEMASTAEIALPEAPPDQLELDRLLELASFEIMDTPAEKDFDELTALAADLCGAPMAVVTLLDADRQWFKSRLGIDGTETPRELSFCAHALHSRGVMVVPDARLDPRFADHPMVTGEPHLRFYAGAPLITADGHGLGALCVLDTVPREFTDTERRHLRVLGDQVLGQLEVRRQARQLSVEVQARLAVDEELREKRRMLDVVLTHTDVLIFAKDLDGRFVMANRALEQVTPVDGGMVGRTDHEIFDRTLADAYRQNDGRIAATRERQVFNEDISHPDGSVHAYRSTKFPLIDDTGMVIGIGGVSTDVTELVAARAAHEEAERRWRALVEQSPVAVAVIGADGLVAYANPQAVALCGASTVTEIEKRPALWFAPDGAEDASRGMFEAVFAGGPPLLARKCLLRQLGGALVTVEINATAMTHDRAPAVLVELRDITAAVTEQAVLEHFASTDPLTGVLNRRAWDIALQGLLDDGHGTGAPLVIAVVDLDDFKAFNDTRGHNAGDALLRDFATSARGELRNEDVFARWGGEEFILALPDTSVDQATAVLDAVRTSVPAGQSCSIGYAVCRGGEEPSETLTRADEALYRAKKMGKNCLELA